MRFSYELLCQCLLILLILSGELFLSQNHFLLLLLTEVCSASFKTRRSPFSWAFPDGSYIAPCCSVLMRLNGTFLLFIPSSRFRCISMHQNSVMLLFTGLGQLTQKSSGGTESSRHSLSPYTHGPRLLLQSSCYVRKDFGFHYCGLY